MRAAILSFREVNTGSSSAVSVGAAAGETSLDAGLRGGAVDAEAEEEEGRDGGVQFRDMGGSEGAVDGKVLKEEAGGAGLE